LRRAIALFITIGLISLISIAIMHSFSLVNKGFKHIENIEKINQTRVVIHDVEAIWQVITKEIKDSDSLYALLGAYPPISDEDGRFTLSMEMRSLQGRVNINSIFKEESSDMGGGKTVVLKEEYYPLFNYIFNKYQVRDGELLLNYILDTFDNDIIERDVGTEIALNSIHFINGQIVNTAQFREVLREYQNRVDDRDVMKIPWEDFFYFGRLNTNSNETMIDCNFMTRNLAKGLELEIDDFTSDDAQEFPNGEDIGSEEISCDMIDNSENETEKEIYHIKHLEVNSSNKQPIHLPYLIEGLVTYTTNAVSESFKFIYNLKSKRIIDIEIQ